MSKHNKRSLINFPLQNGAVPAPGSNRNNVLKSMYKCTSVVENYDGLYYIRKKYHNPQIDKGSVSSIRNAAYAYKELLLTTYSSEQAVYSVPHLPMTTGDSEQPCVDVTSMSDSINKSVSKFSRRIDDSTLAYDSDIFKVITDDYIMYVLCNVGTDKSPMLITMQFIPSRNVCVLKKLIVDEVSANFAVSTACISKKPFMAESYLKSILHDTDADLEYINMVSKLIDLRINGTPTIDKGPDSMNHSKIEMDIYKYLWTHSTSAADTVSLSVRSMYNSDYSDRDTLISTMDERHTVVIDQSIDKVSAPFVKFSEKEWMFVTKYVKSQNLYDSGDHSKTIDLSDVFRKQRYGKDLQFTYMDMVNEGIDLFMTYDYDEDLQCVRITVIHDSDNSVRSQAVVYFAHINNFNFINDLVSVEVQASVKTTNLPKSKAELDSYVPLCFSAALLPDLLIHVIGIYLVIHDRPQRHRVVREERVQRKVQSGDRSAMKGSKTQTDPVVVSRIIMPVKDVDNYINTMKNSYNAEGTVERNYIIESWERSGHWRRLPHSEQKIWIEETTCNRRKPLTDKSVVIKL